MKQTSIISTIFFLLWACSLTAQPIAEKIDFARLEKILQSKDDTTYVINFWATWCKPCVEELPVFEKLNEAKSGQKVRVILVSQDMPKQLESRLIPYIRQKGLKSRIWLLDAPNANAWIEKVSPEWSGALPATVVVRGSKKYYKFYEKSFSYEELEKIVQPVTE